MSETLETIVCFTQQELFKHLVARFDATTVRRDGSYILVPGDAPVLLVAHLDTVHREPVRTICTSDCDNIIMSPQGIGGDDRCGVYALLNIYDNADVKPWLLFTCDEEIGCVGAGVFCKDYAENKIPYTLADLKMIIEIDRKGSKDAVYYECDNPEFEQYVTSHGFVTDLGSYSDISDIAPALGVAAVNLSSGYYNAHTLHEYINKAELAHTIERVSAMITEACADDFPTYEYIECEQSYLYRSAFGGGVSDFFGGGSVGLDGCYYAMPGDFYDDDESGDDSFLFPFDLATPEDELAFAMLAEVYEKNSLYMISEEDLVSYAKFEFGDAAFNHALVKYLEEDDLNDAVESAFEI